MTNPKVLCFLWAFGIAFSYGVYWAYVNRHRIYNHMVDWMCYELCKDMAKRGIPIEPATNWVHKKAVEYAIKHNKKAVFMTVDLDVG